MDFRKVTKEKVFAMMPTEIVDVIRDKASKERRSLSEVTTEFICRGMGRDPSEYGIETTQDAHHLVAASAT